MKAKVRDARRMRLASQVLKVLRLSVRSINAEEKRLIRRWQNAFARTHWGGPCTYGHYDCSTVLGGPCCNEVALMLQQIEEGDDAARQEYDASIP